MRKCYALAANFLFVLLMMSGVSWGQAVTIAGTANISNFNTPVLESLTSFAGSSATASNIANWQLQGGGSSGNNLAGSNQTGGTGGGWYGNSNISFLGSGNASNGNATLRLRNTTSSTISAFRVVYTARMWRSQSSSPSVSVSWSNNASSGIPTVGALSNALNSLSFSDATSNIASGVTLSQTVTGLSIANNDYIFLRWIHSGGSSSDNLGWDEIYFIPQPTIQASAINFSSVSATSMTINWTNGNGARRAVFVRQGSAGTITNPSDGTLYSANADWNFGSPSGSQLGSSGYYCVYDGTGTSVALSNLTAATTYYVQVFEYNSTATPTASTIIYNTSVVTNNPNSQATDGGCTAPNQVTSLTAGSPSSSQFNVSWTAGNGSGSMIVVRPTAQSALNPTSGTAYTPNADYSLAGQINTNNRVVFRGAGTSVTPTNLSAETQYTVTAYEYNSTGECYKLTDMPTVSLYTLSLAPSAHASSFSATATSPTSIGLSFSAASSITNADGYLILQKSGSAPTATPANATGYIVGNTIGDATVAAIVTNTSATTLTINGLTPSTQYYYVLIPFNYNGTDAATYNYYTSATIPGANALTQSLSEPVISSPTAANITSSTAVLGADVTSDGGASISARGIVWAETSLNSNPTIGGANSTDVAGTGTTGVFTVNVSSLPAAKQISYRAYATNSVGTSYTTATTFTTLATAPTTASSGVSFGTFTTSSVQLSWTIGNGERRIVVARLNSTTRVAPTNGTGYTPIDADFSNVSNPTTGTGNMVVYNGVGNSLTVTGLSAGTMYAFDIYEFNGSDVTANYGTQYTVTKTTLAAQPTLQASNITFSNVTATSFKVNWTNGDGANSLVLVKEASAVDAVPQDGISYTANAAFKSGTELGTGNFVVYRATLNTINVTGLTEGTTYYVRVFTYNGTAGSGIENYLETGLATGSQTAMTSTYYSQSAGDPKTMSNWNSLRTGGGLVPSTLADGNFVIQNGHNMTTTTATNFGAPGYKLQIENGGTLTADFAVTMDAGSTLQIDNGGSYIHNNTTTPSSSIFAGTESFAANSNIKINKWPSNTTVLTTGVTLPFGNLEINWTDNTNNWQNSFSGALTLCAGNLKFTSVGTGSFRFTPGSAYEITIGGDLIISSGNISLASSTSSSSIRNINIGGNLSVSGTSTTLGAASGSPTNINFTGSNKSFTNTATITNTVINWAVNNGASLTLNSDLTVGSGRSFTLNPTSSLTIQPNVTLTLTGSADFKDQSVLLRSTNDGTAHLGQVTGTLSGATNVTVERFIGIPTAKRAWRMLTAPLRSATGSDVSIFNTWQEAGDTGVAKTGLGIIVTGAGANVNTNGLDRTSGASMRSFVNGAWVDVTDTKTTPLFTTAANAANRSFAVFVRSDRFSTDLTRTGTTVLRATGALQTGDQTFDINSTADGFTFIGNPYASPLSFHRFKVDNFNNIYPSYWFWNPNNTGNGGAYVTVASDDPTIPNSQSYTITNGAAPDARYIQSGMAFFVRTKTGALANTVVFKEAHKSDSTINNVFRVGTQLEKLYVNIQLLNTTTSSWGNVDGFVARYNNNYSSDLLSLEDISKMLNTEENFSLKRNGNLLAIESRPLIDSDDTLFVSMSNIKQNRSYKFAFDPQNFDAPGLTAYLEDAFLNNATPVSLSAPTEIVFTTTTAAGSFAADRFRIVFKASSTLSTTGLTVKASLVEKQVRIDWSMVNENNVKGYTVERSSDGKTFTALTAVNAKANDNSTVSYDAMDASPLNGMNYYRIKATDVNGKITYSAIVRIKTNDTKASVTVYPNPVKGEQLNIQLNGLSKGTYTLKLYNNLGQEVYGSTLQVTQTAMSQTLNIAALKISGVYTLRITNGEQTIEQTIVAQ